MRQQAYNPPMCPEMIVCPSCEETAQGTISVHSRKERRYKCKTCGKTFAETAGTPLQGLKYPIWIVSVVMLLLAYGCPIQAVVLAFVIDERTVQAWQRRFGQHGRQVQEAIVCNGQVDVGQVQGDELYAKTQYGPVWVATALSVFSRLFIWGAVSAERNETLVTKVVTPVKRAAVRGRPILWATDGFAAWAKAIGKVFRDPVRVKKPGRPRLVLWAEMQIVQVVKQYAQRRVVAVERRLLQGCWQMAQELVMQTQVGWGLFNTAYIERFNATLRTWLPSLTRRTRTPARRRAQMEDALFWTGCMYNFCHVHASLQGTPAMAAGLTERVWSVHDLIFCFRFRREKLHAIL